MIRHKVTILAYPIVYQLKKATSKSLLVSRTSRNGFFKATKNIRNIPELPDVGISQDLTESRSRVAFLACEAVRKENVAEEESDISVFQLLLEYECEDLRSEDFVPKGDFNDDQMYPRQSKMREIFTRYGMSQFVEEPTNFCENSASIIDLVLSNNLNPVDLVHVGQPFLPANMDPILLVCLWYTKISQTVKNMFKRKIWLYDSGDYNLFRRMLSDVNWNDFIESSINVDSLVERFSELLIDFALKAIPNKTITVRKSDPPWMNSYIRRTIRKRNPYHITNFKSRDMNIPPINLNSSVIDDDTQKAEAFSDYFASQSNIDDSNKLLPEEDIPPDRRLSYILFRNERS
ncbi:unnamed protein product [Mytilus coruscus]|uniref:Uncharacterized protein n=1 Tax=Mytilus coruscus TaxID=42192 RepID=A0A6J8B4N8_MYTCO|nr:unnamed protein product [Mytilus coruscus]